MPVRKTTSAVTVLGLTALALAGCAQAQDPETSTACGRADGASSALSSVSVEGDFLTETPTIEAPASFHSTGVQYHDQVEGNGAVVTSDEQPVVLSVDFVNPATQESVALSPVPAMTISAWQDMLPGLGDALQCAAEGSRVIAALGETGINEDFGAQLPSYIATDGSDFDLGNVITVIDVDRVYLASADGSLVYNAGGGMPSVVRNDDGVPGITIPNSKAPTSQKTETLIKGDGDEIADGDTVTVHYTSVNWETSSVSSSTWDSGTPTSATLDELPDGFADALKGATVGSQVVTVVPGDSGAATVSVIDVLGVDAQ
ncbi:hypothetical protein GCM10010922_04310 [Microbacterium sorbitolivorans]|nr:hypothetical protein GCM10010922_04310 [Microbacterium sorbitolivorans]